MSPYGDYLSAGDSVSFIPFYLLAFRCLHAVVICLPDMDRMSVLVLSDRCSQSVCFSCREESRDRDRDCLPVSPCGDYLPVGDSVSFIPFYLFAFQCLHAVIICLPVIP